MNYCNGNGTCNTYTGNCDCNPGFKFADCSKKVTDLTEGLETSFNNTGPFWYTMQYSGGDKNTTLTLSADQPSSVYIAKGKDSDPNNFVYDMDFVDLAANTTMVIDSSELGLNDGYSIAVYVSAVDETANKLYPGILNISFEDAISSFTASIAMILSVQLLALS